MANSKLLNKNTTPYVAVALAVMMVAVFLTGCSNGSAGLDQLKASAASLVPAPKPNLPEAPPQLKKCLKKKLPQVKVAADKKPTADDKVINAMAWGQEQQICGQNLLEWYEDTRKANTDEGTHPKL